MHDPGKVLVDVAIVLAASGDCPADVAVLRTGAALFGPVPSDPTISRLVDTLAAEPDEALTAIRGAHAQARTIVPQHAPLPAGEVVVDIDAMLLSAFGEGERRADL